MFVSALRLCLASLGVACASFAVAQTPPATVPEVVLPSNDLQRYVPSLTDEALALRLSGPGPVTALVPQDRPVVRLPGAPTWPTDPDAAALAARALVVDGLWTPEALEEAARRTDGRMVLETDSGASLLITDNGRGGIVVVDPLGNTAKVLRPFRPSMNGGVLVLDAPLSVR